MSNVEIYTGPHCSYCVMAKRLLDNKGVSYTEHDIGRNQHARDEMQMRTQGRRTLPQILINGKPVGGFTDLYMLDQNGELDALLAGNGD